MALKQPVSRQHAELVYAQMDLYVVTVTVRTRVVVILVTKVFLQILGLFQTALVSVSVIYNATKQNAHKEMFVQLSSVRINAGSTIVLNLFTQIYLGIGQSLTAQNQHQLKTTHQTPLIAL